MLVFFQVIDSPHLGPEPIQASTDMGIQLPWLITDLLSNRTAEGNPARASNRYDGVSIVMAIIAIFAVSRLLKVYHGLKLVHHLPGIRAPFSPYSLPGFMLPSSWWNPGYRFMWNGRNRHQLYKRHNSETFSIMPWLVGDPMIISSNLDVLRQVAFGSIRTDWEKPVEFSQSLVVWGNNVAAAQGETWRKHRRIVNPAFNTKLYHEVWKKSADIYAEMVEAEGWNTCDTVDIPVVQKHTFLFALLVISTCGFGLPFKWIEPPIAEEGTMTIQQALQMINDRNTALTALPEWTLRLPWKYFRELAQAKEVMRKFMDDQVAQKKQLVGTDTSGSFEDAFTLMVRASEEEGSKYSLDDDELIGNVFVMLFAGHETTAHTLAASLAYLACNPKLEQEMLDEIISVVGWDRKPAFEDYENLDKVLSLFIEALRMFPAGHIMFRQATKDTTVQLPRPTGQEGFEALPLPKGTLFCIDMVGLQHNPRYFEDPDTFNPSRWYGVPKDGDAFTAFSLGPRGCIGRKFATIEAVSFLTLFIRDWKVEPLLRKGESLEAWKERVLDAQMLVTLGVKDTPIRLVRRHKPTPCP